MKKIEFIKFEENIQILGGFSEVYQSGNDTSKHALANNCHSGICNLGNNKRLQKNNSLKGINNCHTNCISGCGQKK